MNEWWNNIPKQQLPVFTPRLGDTQERLQLTLSLEDMKVRLTGAIVTDLTTGKRYRAWPAPCGCDCYCDAVAVEVTE
jgi:hypothetical protein